MVETGPELPTSESPGDEAGRCRDLVVLVFRAVLHREPEEVDAAAFTNALLGGMPVYAFISELMSTPEFRRPDNPTPRDAPPAPTTPTATLAGTMRLSLGLLQARLADKGCLVQLGPAPELDQGVDAVRMERVMRTLAMLDAL